jgi:hypothetical protein
MRCWVTELEEMKKGRGKRKITISSRISNYKFSNLAQHTIDTHSACVMHVRANDRNFDETLICYCLLSF